MKTLWTQLDEAAARASTPASWPGYAWGVGLAALAILVIAVWQPGFIHAGPLLGVPAIIIAAGLGGLGPGLATTAAMLVGSWFLDLHLPPSDNETFSHLVLTAAYGVTIAAGAEGFRRQRAKAEGNARSLSIREAHLQLMLDTVPDAMLVCDEAGIVRSFSSAAERMFGWSADDILGHCVTRLMDDAAAQSGLQRFIFSEHHIPTVTTGLRRDGTNFPLEVTVAGFQTSGHAFFTIIARDRTTLEDAARKEAELRSDLAFALRQSSVGEMASMLAHEINQPLAAITNYLGAARNLASHQPAQSGRVAEAIDRASEQAMRASEIIRRLRTLVGRSDEGQRPEDLKALILEIDVFVRPIARESDVRVEYRFDDQPMIAMADRIQVQQVVLNLVRNAVDAMSAAPRRLLTISARPNGDEVQIRIEDSGPGIHENLLPQLFLPVRSSKPNGMGIGLSICRTIVEAHGGRIWCEKSTMEGTAICFTLNNNKKETMDVAAA